MKWGAIGAIAVCLAHPSSAMEVLSGEHESFSRLVFPAPSETRWEVSRQNSRVTFKFTGLRGTFELDQVFSKIPKDRLNAISSNGSSALHLDLNCDCGVSAFSYKNRYIVIDISDAITSDPSAPMRPVPTPPLSLAWALDSVPQDQISYEWPVEADLEAAPQTTTTPADTGQFETELTAFLDAGIGAGVLAELGPSPIEPAPSHTRKPIDTRSISQTVISEHLSISGDLLEAPAQPAVTCADKEILDFDTFKDAQDSLQELGVQRRNILDENGIVSDSGIQALARTYIALGFGEEARATLSLLPDFNANTKTLSIVAEVLITGYSQHHPYLTAQQNCGVQVALWAYLAHPSPDINSEETLEVILRNFTNLPSEVKSYLKPFLQRRFIQSGQTDAIAFLDRSVDETHTPDSLSAALSATEIPNTIPPLSTGGLTEGDLANLNDFEAISLAQKTLSRALDGEQITRETVELLQAFRKEFSGTAIETELQSALATAHLVNGQPGETKSILKTLPEPLATNLTSKLMEFATWSLDDALLLDFVWDLAPYDEKFWNTDQSLMTGQRLLELGFGDIILDRMVHRFTAEHEQDRRLMRARAAMLGGKFRLAQREMLGAQGSEAEELRDQLIALAGALPLDVAPNDIDAPDEIISEASQAPTTVEPPEITEFEEQVTALETPQSNATPPLQASKNLLKSSQSLRALIANQFRQAQEQL